MWIIDLSFLQESANIFEKYFMNKYYKIHTYSGKEFLIINDVKNYPHLIGIHFQQLRRLRGSSFLFSCIKNNDTSQWTNDMKRTFNHIFPNCIPYGNNDIKITFFPLMPDIFINNNYVISVNYDKTRRTDNRSFDTEILISDFNDGMNIGMKQRSDGSFGFNSWRVEENENEIMNLYTSQEIDLIKKIEQYENGYITFTKTQSITEKNLWRLSRLTKNYNVTIIDSPIKNKILFLSNFDDSDFKNALSALKSKHK